MLKIAKRNLFSKTTFLIVLTFIQIAIAYYFPRAFKSQTNEEFLDKYFHREFIKSEVKKLSVKAEKCAIFSPEFLRCDIQSPSKNIKKLLKFVFAYAPTAEIILYAVVIVSFLIYSSWLTQFLFSLETVFSKIIFLTLSLFSNPVLALILFEPFTLMSAILLLNFKNSSIIFWPLRMFAMLLNPLISSFIFLSLRINLSVSDKITYFSLLGLTCVVWTLVGADPFAGYNLTVNHLPLLALIAISHSGLDSSFKRYLPVLALSVLASAYNFSLNYVFFLLIFALFDILKSDKCA
ncbi:MAG: hypothetical protein NZT61_00425 [Deltaproteobacteria bacterium]|nr:hypothetical protein [Deltaproteobacteria bacterium]MCX7952689.1 hypothetical protein [Deltaproteobacteria bacterium]